MKILLLTLVSIAFIVSSKLDAQIINVYTVSASPNSQTGSTPSPTIDIGTITTTQSTPFTLSFNGSLGTPSGSGNTGSAFILFEFLLTSNSGAVTSIATFQTTLGYQSPSNSYAQGSVNISGACSSLPAGTYTLGVHRNQSQAGVTLANELTNVSINGSVSLIAAQSISPTIQAALDAITAAQTAGDAATAAQLAVLGNRIATLESAPGFDPTAINSELASLKDQLASLTTDVSSLSSQVASKAPKQSILLQYGPAAAAAALGVGSNYFLNDHSSGSRSKERVAGARPGYYD